MHICAQMLLKMCVFCHLFEMATSIHDVQESAWEFEGVYLGAHFKLGSAFLA